MLQRSIASTTTHALVASALGTTHFLAGTLCPTRAVRLFICWICCFGSSSPSGGHYPFARPMLCRSRIWCQGVPCRIFAALRILTSILKVCFAPTGFPPSSLSVLYSNGYLNPANFRIFSEFVHFLESRHRRHPPSFLAGKRQMNACGEEASMYGACRTFKLLPTL